MLRKLVLSALAVAAVALAIFSYTKYYARKDISQALQDARLTASVKTALALNRHLRASDIDVSVTNGEVTLSGQVGTDIQRELAREIALSIRGTDKVVNNTVVNRSLTVRPAVRERTLGEKLDDLTIEASIKTALLLNENVRAREIGVRSKRGAVTLAGKVSSAAEAELARKIAEDIEGVLTVENHLEIESGDETDDRKFSEKVDDTRIVAQVRAALMVNRNIDSTEIEVSSRNGIVTLTGIVPGGAEKDLAQEIAEDCRGVQGVINELRIR